LFCATVLTAFQNSRVRDAASALQRGEYAVAERLVRIEIADYPDDAWSISLLGYSLDQQKRYREADALHRRAVELSPRSAEILNNYGTHLWMLEDYAKAEGVFSEALAVAPTYFNVVLAMHVRYSEARQALEAASALGFRNLIADFFATKPKQGQQPVTDEAIYVNRFFDGGLLKP
jgi:Flp pilus assembly protein TadD